MDVIALPTTRPELPVCVAQWDVAGPFPAGEVEAGRPLHVVVRLGGEPVGFVDVESGADGGAAVSGAVTESLLNAINRRLSASGLSRVTQIPARGLGVEPERLAFVADRDRLMRQAPSISVVVCTRDRADRLADCLRRLATQRYPDYEVVVVDNAPTDPAAVTAVLKDLAVPVRYVLEPHGGLAWARNAGWRAASAEIVAFLDDDEIPDGHWLAELARGFAAGESVACVTGMILPAEIRTEAQLWMKQYGGVYTGRGINREVFGAGHPQSPLYPLPPFGAGGNMAFRRQVLEEIDGFNVALGAGTPAKGAEDTFAFTRVLLGGRSVVYQPSALVWHYDYESVDDLARQLQGYGTGVVAYYAALLHWRPSLVVPIAGLVLAGLRDLRGRGAEQAAALPEAPARLRRTRRRRGMIRGVPAYLRSVTEQRRKSRLSGEAGPKSR